LETKKIKKNNMLWEVVVSSGTVVTKERIMHNPVYQTARQFVLCGIAVIPVVFKDKKPAIKTWKKYQDELPSMDQVATWFRRGEHNYGVVTGWDGLTVLDFDDITEYTRWLFWLGGKDRMSQLVGEMAFRVGTSRGVHVYIRLPQAIQTRKIDKIDIKSKGGYVLGPWSTHPSGAIYEPLRETWVIPRVNALSDILPAGMLLQHTELSKVVNVPVLPVSQSNDPWAIASSPILSGNRDQLIKAIKARYKIEDFFPDRQATSDDKRWYLTRCPFHDDHTPSFWLDLKNQIGDCFACRFEKPLDVINLYARLYGLSNLEAIRVMGREHE